MNRNRYPLLAPPPAVDSSAFVICPVLDLPPLSPTQEIDQRKLYEWALAKAIEVARPSILERDLLGVWN